MRSPEPSDPELLAAWLEHQREPAFRSLVARYAGLVHMTAKRTCGDDSIASDAAQLTFIALAQKAKSLATCATLGGWLHRTAMMQARNLARKSQRENRKRQQLAMEPRSQSQDEAWREIQPVLDDALAALSDKDREALILRFYRALTIREVAETLGIASDAAQKRIDRATERLRGKLTRSGVQTGPTLGAAMLAGFGADAQAAAAVQVSILTSKAIAAGAAGTGIASHATAFLSATAMKSTSAALPIVILLASGIWIASQFHSIARLEETNSLLQKHLAAGSSVASAPTKRPSIKTALDGKPVDWEEVARQLEKDGGGWAPLTTNLRLLDALQSMSESELSAALDEIATARLSPQSRELLDRRLGTLLMTKNPEQGLTRFVRRCQGGDWSWLLASQLANWAKADPEKAVTWFSTQIAAGSFDRTSPGGGLNVPPKVVHAAVFALLESAPDAASRLLTALPEDARLKSLVSIQNRRLGKEEHLTQEWVKMVRRHLPDSDRIKAITWPTMNWSDGDGRPMDLSKTSAYMSRIGATAEEIDACVLCVAGQVHSWRPFFTKEPKTPTEGLEALRAWVATEAPRMRDRATAAALGAQAEGSGHGDHFPEVAKLALQYHDQGGGDALLVPVLEASNANEHKELARTLAARLTDGTLRKKYLDDFKPSPLK